MATTEFWCGILVMTWERSPQNVGSFPQCTGERAVAARGGTLSGGGTALTCQVTALGDANVVSRVAARDADHRHHPGRYKCSEQGIIAPDRSCPVQSSVHITNGYTFQLCGILRENSVLWHFAHSTH